ncbi:hypothetical protein [Sphaerisporangium aureirubrum]|uniref:Uncharacterized protein n=1 Tax=Sphaerisporangium aureirubrum TaxID=1544736 RepID=A0ABW1NXK8_9ACTN
MMEPYRRDPSHTTDGRDENDSAVGGWEAAAGGEEREGNAGVKDREETTGPVGSGDFDRLGNRDYVSGPVDDEEKARVREESDRLEDEGGAVSRVDDETGEKEPVAGVSADRPGDEGHHDGDLHGDAGVGDGAGPVDGPGPVYNPDHDGDLLVAGRDEASEPDPEHGPEEADRFERTAATGQPADLIVYPEKSDLPDPDDLSAPAAEIPETEPVLAPVGGDAPDVVPPTPATPSAAETGTDFRQRWREVQAGFVDDPRDAVRQADELVDEAVSAVVRRKQELTDRWKDADQGDTERLRVTLREYRSLLDELVVLTNYPAGADDRSARPFAR